MFRVSIAPIVRSTRNCSCSLWYRSYYLGNKLLQTWHLVGSLQPRCQRNFNINLHYLFVHMLVHNKYLSINMHRMNIKKSNTIIWTKLSHCVLILCIHFINIYFHQHNYVIKAWVRANATCFDLKSYPQSKLQTSWFLAWPEVYYILVLTEIYINKMITINWTGENKVVGVSRSLLGVQQDNVGGILDADQ